MKKLILICSIASFIGCDNVSFKMDTDKKCANESNSQITKTCESPSNIEEGKRLVTALGCNDCHSPKKMTEFGPVPDENLLLSGHPQNMPLADYDPSVANSGAWILFSGSGTAAVGPWGTSFASNLTPHETGIGNWTFEQFTKAMREGKSKGLENGRMILPPMPWMGYKSLKDDELKAIFDYLQSLKPIENLVPLPLPPKR